MTMKRLKIAVCLSGQPRTWKSCVESIHSFFSNIPHDVYFFAHIWDTNSWIGPNRQFIEEVMDKYKLSKELQDAIPFKKFSISKQAPYTNGHDDLTWYPMFKSIMLANQLKIDYEQEHDMIFDIVVRARLDTIYNGGENLAMFIDPSVPISNTRLYCSIGEFANEFNFQVINDTVFFGASHIMDTMCGFFHYYSNGNFFKMMNTTGGNPAWRYVGPGAMLYKWATIKNIGFHNAHINTVPVRKSAEHLKWPHDFYKFMEIYENGN